MANANARVGFAARLHLYFRGFSACTAQTFYGRIKTLSKHCSTPIKWSKGMTFLVVQKLKRWDLMKVMKFLPLMHYTVLYHAMIKCDRCFLEMPLGETWKWDVHCISSSTLYRVDWPVVSFVFICWNIRSTTIYPCQCQVNSLGFFLWCLVGSAKASLVGHLIGHPRIWFQSRDWELNCDISPRIISTQTFGNSQQLLNLLCVILHFSDFSKWTNCPTWRTRMNGTHW